MKKFGKLVNHLKESWCAQFGHKPKVVHYGSGPLTNSISLKFFESESPQDLVQCTRCDRFYLMDKKQ